MDIAGIKQGTKQLVKENILRAEREGRFNDEVLPPDYDAMLPVTDDYEFIPKNLGFVLWSLFVRTVALLGAKPLVHIAFGGRVRGRQNLRGLKGAVLVCNHVHILDNMLVRHAVRGHRLYITVAEFNSMKGILGWILRGAGTLPFSHCFSAMKKMGAAITTLLKKGNFVLFYPEKALWPRYEKPRPFIEGAFHCAVVNDVPLVPVFIRWREPSKLRRLFSKQKVAELHILEPLYIPADQAMPRKEKMQLYMEESFRLMSECAAQD